MDETPDLAEHRPSEADGFRTLDQRDCSSTSRCTLGLNTRRVESPQNYGFFRKFG